MRIELQCLLLSKIRFFSLKFWGLHERFHNCPVWALPMTRQTSSLTNTLRLSWVTVSQICITAGAFLPNSFTNVRCTVLFDYDRVYSNRQNALSFSSKWQFYTRNELFLLKFEITWTRVGHVIRLSNNISLFLKRPVIWKAVEHPRTVERPWTGVTWNQRSPMKEFEVNLWFLRAVRKYEAILNILITHSSSLIQGFW